MKVFSSISLVFLFTISINAQIDTSSFRKNLENILEDITEDKDNSQFYDQVEYLLENPININNATEDDLIQIPFLDREDAAVIIKQRNALGKFDSPEQLRNTTGVSEDVINKILPFLFSPIKKHFR